MSEEKEETKNKLRTGLDVTSKFWKTVLVVLAAFLTFAGPTYVIYVLLRILKIDYAISMITGFGLFIVGLALIWYLIKKKVIS
jgi:hypothetical protein